MDRARFDDSYRSWSESPRKSSEASIRRLPTRENGSLSLTYVVLANRHANVNRVAQALQDHGIANVSWLVCLDDPSSAAAAQLPTSAIMEQKLGIARVLDWIRTDGSWLPPGEGSHVVLVSASTIIAKDMPARLLEAIVEHADADWIYTDEDRIDDRGVRSDPYLKAAFNLPLAAVDDYATRLAVARRSTIEQAGGLRNEYGDAQIYELLLRIAMAGGRIEHLPEVGCHLDGPARARLSRQHQTAAERVIFGSSNPAAIESVTVVTSGSLELQRVSWKSDPTDAPQVTIVIPTRDRIDLLRACIDSVCRTVDPRRTQLLIVDDQSQDEETLSYLQALERDSRLRFNVVRSPGTDRVFNYAGLMNMAAPRVQTPLMLHLNNDIQPAAPGWLDQMAGWMSFPHVGVVGAKLLYPDDSIQHAGVVVSPGTGALEHFQSFLLADDPGYQLWPHRVREVSAVTGACLLTSTKLFQSLGGFDEQNFGVQFNDIDFCLRARQAGKRVVYEPSAVLYHLTSASRGSASDYNETLCFLKKYAGYRDPFISPHLDPVSVCGPTPALDQSR